MHYITKKKDLPNECLFFGYGSLMYPSGINGRGLRHKYLSHDELIPYTVKGLKRSMSAEIIVIEGFLRRFYSVEINKDSEVFGMLFKVHSLYDLIALLCNEAAFPINHNSFLYKTLDITDLVESELPVLTLETKEMKDNPLLYYPGYVKNVYKGIQKEYRKPFLRTGGLKE